MHKLLRGFEESNVETPPVDPARIRSAIDRIHVETALALNLHGSFRKAAEALNMKPATVNRRIRDLEFLVGVPLFERRHRRAVPTRLGKIFLRQSGRMFVDFHTMVDGMRRISNGQAGEVAIGYYGPLGAGPLQDLLLHPDSELGDVKPVPIEFASGCLFDALIAETIDLAIVHGRTSAFKGESHLLWHERVFAVMPQGHRLAEHTSVRWGDLVGETFLLSHSEPSEDVRAFLSDRIRPEGGAPVVIEHNVSLPTIFRMVRAGHGLCLCLESALASTADGLEYREVLGPDGPEFVPASACWLAEHQNPALGRLLSLLRRKHGSAAIRRLSLV
ncbi:MULTISPECIES: LysR family transcriptional regulator [unclassified Novosphingobium]|uniref:LysR substrate-binding domain-containing protein n=1 Tax=unclassified Novosphingobium TaxID=2644732 RepID=UPI00146C06F6|nr:DNA-binding transcriptional LysR family regulator [Novosphingobium sp. SG919]NMN86140.1 DNA-binding transcriptional LysR family regulator [Novosphingobium sp. SG916]